MISNEATMAAFAALDTSLPQEALAAALAAGASLSQGQGEWGWNLLARAVWEGHSEEVVTLLLRAGADPNQVGHAGLTPTLLALAVHHPQALRALVSAGGRTDLTAAHQATAWHVWLSDTALPLDRFAAALLSHRLFPVKDAGQDHVDVLTWLRQGGADARFHDASALCPAPVFLAMRHQNEPLLRLFDALGGDWWAPDAQGQVPARQLKEYAKMGDPFWLPWVAHVVALRLTQAMAPLKGALSPRPRL